MKKVGFILFPLVLVACIAQINKKNELPNNEIELGKILFNDPILSLDKSISCASCHIPAFAFADTTPFSLGVGGKMGTRNTPSVTNMASRSVFFWDGRANTLAEQALMPIANPIEMNLPIDMAIARLNKNNYYIKAFDKIYHQTPNAENLGKAFAAFEESLETTSTPFDKFMKGDTNAISASAKRGQFIFNEKAACFDCHFSPDFTGDEFKNIGLFNGKNLNDSGRINITKKQSDLGSFKVPGLRNIAQTAPYMHNGMMKTLEEVVAFYNNPDAIVPNAINRDSTIKKLNLSTQEQEDLVNFLKTLSPYK